jgi:hypothetical protein
MVQRVCPCGTSFEARGNARKLCDTCQVEHRRESRRLWYLKNRDTDAYKAYRLAVTRRHQAKKGRSAPASPEKRRPRDVVYRALKDGRLTKGPCERGPDGCSGKIHAHHDDYSKPLEVRWLCQKHHGEEHRVI